MWQLKIKARERWNLYNSRAVKFSVTLYFYSRNYFEKDNKLYFIGAGTIEGDEKNRAGFLRDLNKDKKVKKLEWENEFFTCVYKEDKTAERVCALKTVYNPALIHLKPVIFDKEGWEEWEVASLDKKDLDEIITQAEKLKSVEYKVLSFKETKINNILVYSLLPFLTEKQKNVFLLAIKEGYYGYPRKITLKKLAKMVNLSISTYQFHLAKAEAKLLPFVAKSV